MTVLVGRVGETQKVAFALIALQDKEVRDGQLWSRKEQARRRNNLPKSKEERLILLLPKEVIPCVECGSVEGTPCWEEQEAKRKQWRGHENPRQTWAVSCGTSWGTVGNVPLC